MIIIIMCPWGDAIDVSMDARMDDPIDVLMDVRMQVLMDVQPKPAQTTSSQ